MTIALVTWLVTRDDGDASSLAGLPGVERVAGDVVHLSADATPAEVRKVLGAQQRSMASRRLTVPQATWR